MNPRSLFQSLRDWLNRLISGPQQTTASGRKRRVSRREREARRKRQLYFGLTIVGIVVVGVLAVGFLNDYWFKPRHVLASVNGVEIRRRDYWKVRSYELINQINFYNQYATLMQGDQQQQYLQLAQQAATELDDVWGSTDVNADTLNTMVEDQIYLQNMKSLGLKINDQDIQNYIYQLFGPSDTPIITPTPSPTLIPQRAAWATETAEANATASAVASPVAGTPAAGTPVGTPVAGTPEAGGTPNIEAAKATAEASFKSYKDSVFGKAHLSQSDFDRLIAKPAIARQMVSGKLAAQVGQSAEQVHAAHILVGTKDLAEKIYSEVTQPGANFAEIAKKESTDTATAANGGDLGWFTRGEMVKPFADVAFSLKPGEISKPFQTQYGWHIVKVYAHEQNRAMTDAQISQQQQLVVQQWLDQQKQKMKIHAEVVPTATPTSSAFTPPPDAPTPPAATPVTSPVASPGATPGEATPAGATPVASPTSP